MVVDTVPDDLPEHTVIVADDRSAIPNARSFADLDGWGHRFTSRWPRPPDRSPAPAGLKRSENEPSPLDYFTRRYFQVPELKDEQITLLQRILSGQDAIGILPTGFGKSLVFQLYALLTPRVTLVISPLKALIQDQIGALRRLGWTCVDSVLSTDTTEQRKRRLD
ncbi:DEAD/DEAH box helicase, partial [Arthrospira platensis SPKY1]|nr:DEAD/DEAH box helicase [Arthrospira platensis SPKY1]